MPNLFYQILFLIISYLIGSIPTGYLIGKSKGIDIREKGSNNIGATNTARVLGKKYFLLVTFLDAMKGFIFVFLFRFNILPYEWCLISPILYGIFAVLGHVFPVFLKFKGGKAVATGAGVALGYSPVICVIGIIAFLASYLPTKIVSIGSIVAASSIMILSIISSILTKQIFLNLNSIPTSSVWPLNLWFVIGVIIIVIIIIIKHKTNINRLMHNEEKQFDLTTNDEK